MCVCVGLSRSHEWPLCGVGFLEMMDTQKRLRKSCIAGMQPAPPPAAPPGPMMSDELVCNEIKSMPVTRDSWGVVLDIYLFTDFSNCVLQHSIYKNHNMFRSYRTYGTLVLCPLVEGRDCQGLHTCCSHTASLHLLFGSTNCECGGVYSSSCVVVDDANI